MVTGGDYDLTTPDGRLSARIVGAVARKESEDRSHRVRRKHLELAKLGRPYLCAGRRPGHQLGIIADPVDELVREIVLRLLTTPSVREALLAPAGASNDATVGRALADLGAAQSRLQALDDDFSVRGVLAEGRYRSIRVKLEREIDRLTPWSTPRPGSASSCTPIRVRSGRKPTSNSGATWFG